jgi:hypothetical protein
MALATSGTAGSSMIGVSVGRMGMSIFPVELGQAALLAPHGVAPFLRRAADLALAIARLTLGLRSGLTISRGSRSCSGTQPGRDVDRLQPLIASR